MSVKWHFASMAPIPSHATAFRSYIGCVNSRLISRLQSYIFACCSNHGCIYYLIPLDIQISPSEPPFHLAMSNTLAQEIHLTIQTLQSSLTALQSLQQKHNSNGSVHLPLCMKTVDLDVRTRLHKLQHDAQFVPELMEQLTAHFAAMAISVCTMQHSCDPNMRFIMLEPAFSSTKVVRSIPAGGTQTVDFSKVGCLSNVETMTRFCVACRGPCANADGGTE
jgi:hypothetical protein